MGLQTVEYVHIVQYGSGYGKSGTITVVDRRVGNEGEMDWVAERKTGAGDEDAVGTTRQG